MRINKQIELFKLLLKTPYDYQLELIKALNEKKAVIVNKSRQVGISYAIAAWALIRALTKGKIQLIISPSLRQSKHVMDYVYEHLKKIRDVIDVKITEETKSSIMFENGGCVYSLPNNPNTVRGFRADDIFVDEFAHFTQGTDKEIVDAITPSILRGGNIAYISTPFGDRNLFYEFWHNADERGLYRILINYRECKHMNDEHLKKIREILTDDLSWAQEMENQFITDVENAEFSFELINSCINNELELKKDPVFEREKRYVGGVDVGRTEDKTAIVVLEKKDNKYITTYKQMLKNVTYEAQERFIKYILSNAFFDYFCIDATGIGNELAERIKHEFKVDTLIFNNKNKQELVQNLKQLMQEKKIELAADTQLINSIRMIKRVYTDSNYLRFESEHDKELGHADLFWALALAVYCEKKRKNVRGFRL